MPIGIDILISEESPYFSHMTPRLGEHSTSRIIGKNMGERLLENGRLEGIIRYFHSQRTMKFIYTDAEN